MDGTSGRSYISQDFVAPIEVQLAAAGVSVGVTGQMTRHSLVTFDTQAGRPLRSVGTDRFNASVEVVLMGQLFQISVHGAGTHSSTIEVAAK